MIFGEDDPVDKLTAMDPQDIHSFVRRVDQRIEKIESEIQGFEDKMFQALRRGASSSKRMRVVQAQKCKGFKRDIGVRTRKLMELVQLRTIAGTLKTIRENDLAVDDNLFADLKEMMAVDNPADLKDLITEVTIEAESSAGEIEEMSQLVDSYARHNAVASMEEDEFTAIMDEMASVEEGKQEQIIDDKIQDISEQQLVTE